MKTIFITGVGKGLGREFFNQLLQRGYFVYGLLRNAEQYRTMLADLPANAKLVLADISIDDCRTLIREAVGEKPVDLLINNAGIGGEGLLLDDVEPDEISRLIQVHCLGALRVTQALKPALLKGLSPTVVNMSSRFGSIQFQYDGTLKKLNASYAYRIGKAAQNMLTVCLRAELGDRIEFVSMTPGRLVTELAQKDANLSPAEGAARIIESWERGELRAHNGILQVPDSITPW